ncbi:MAG: glutathione S-transferase N-terminal domain-containing protein [Anaeromyxobacter sp.]
MSSPLVLHGTRTSGHTHRVFAFLSILGLAHRFEDSPQAVRRTAAFLALNPLGQVPVLEDGELVLADSNAILVYLARRYAPGSPWLPDDPVVAAHVQRWFSIAAGELFQGPALARLGTLWGRGVDVARAREAGARLLAFLEGVLGGRAWLAAGHPTLADLSLYPYVARAPEGRLDLAPLPAVRAWIDRVEALPGMPAMPRTPIPDGAP